MSKQLVDFEQGTALTGDSNERGNGVDGVEAIKPYDDGEPATAATFDRPIENLRQRTEVLRVETEAQKYLSDSDMRWILSKGNADGQASLADEPWIENWNPATGVFEITPPSAGLVVQPLNTPPEDLQETLQYYFPTGVPAGFLDISMLRHDCSKANLREIHWIPKDPADILGISAGKCSFQLLGEDSHILEIWYSNLNDATLQNLKDVFDPSVATLNAAGFGYLFSGSLAEPILMSYFDDYLIPGPPGPLPAHYYFYKTFDRELHYITPTVLSDFFLTVANRLQDGDTLAVYFEYFIDPDGTHNGRREAIPSYVTKTTVGLGSLFNTRVDPGKIPGCIPICKRIGDDLLWLDGTLVPAPAGLSVPIRMGEHGYTVKRIYSAPSTVPLPALTYKWYGTATVPSWSTVYDAINGIVYDLAGGAGPNVLSTKGAHLIGMHATSESGSSYIQYNVPSPTGDGLDNVIETIIGRLNNKPEATWGNSFGNNQVISGWWRFDQHLRLGESIALLRETPATDTWELVYRNDGMPNTNSAVGHYTYSMYEKVSGTYAGILQVIGGYYDNADALIHVVAGSGPVAFTFWANSATVPYYMGFKRTITGPTTINPALAASWDYHRMISWDGVRFVEAIDGADTHFRCNVDAQFFGWTKFDEYTSFQNGGEIDLVEGNSRIYLASVPWTTIIDGFYAEGPSNVDPFGVYTVWQPNMMLISAGRALVQGVPVNKINPTYLDLSSSANWMADVTSLPTNDTIADTYRGTAGIPGWYYLWLRKDGDFFISREPPIGDYETGIYGASGTYLYRPHQASVHPSFAREDYILCDVVALMHYIGGSWYFDNAPCVGGSERRMRARNRPGGAAMDYDIDHVTVDTVSADISTFVNTAATQRSPGLPLGVTYRGLFNIFWSINVDAEEDAYAYYNLACSETTPWFAHGDHWGRWDATQDSGGAWVGAKTSGGKDVEVLVTSKAPPYGMIERGFRLVGTNTTGQMRTKLRGFFWDRLLGGSYRG